MISVETPEKLDVKDWIMADQVEVSKRFFSNVDKVIIAEVKSAFDGSRQTQDSHLTASKWDPTSIAALVKRRSYPKGVGEGAAEAFFKTAPTLRDTGKLQRSFQVADARTDPKQDFVLVIDSSDDPQKVELLNEGGILNIEGRNFRLPPRRFLELNDRVQAEIMKSYEGAQA